MKMEDRIDDVDEIFEAFVKKKLKQLGMKRAATKSCDGTMNELEMNVKLRLEQNMNIAENAEDLPKKDETENKPKKLKKNKKEKKKRKRGSEDVKQKKLKSRTDDKDAGGDVIPGQNQIVNTEMRQSLKISNVCESDKKEVSHVSSQSNTSEQSTVNKQKMETETTANNTMFGPMLPPKKDITTIKMKVELLKAKSARDETLNQARKLLDSKSNPDTETVKTGQESKEERKTRSRRADSSDSSTSRTRSKSRSCSHDRRRHHSHRRSRSRSRSRRKHHSRRRSKSPRRHHRQYRSRSRDRHHHKHRRDSPARRKSRRTSSPIITKEDKVKLLEIAKANALAQHRANNTASSFATESQILQQSSMSVKELTDICKDIASGTTRPLHSTVEETKESAQKVLADVSVHHPFALKETPIAINIKTKFPTAPPIVSKPVSELSREFPVSCGQQHRRKEVLEGVYGKWELVAKDEVIKKVVKDLVTTDKVFPDSQNISLDISTVIAQRVSAARQLEENPNSDTAKAVLRNAQQQLDDWTKSKQVLGQFTGSSALHAMPKQQLEGGRQAWFKQEEFNNAKHVAGIGKCLLQKMGWKPGMALGKTMPGQLEPLSLTVKSDRRGLSSFMECPASSKGSRSNETPIAPKVTIKDLSVKHPVSVLMEICSKRRWQPPQFSLVDPLDIKLFQFKVTIVNEEYIGQPASNKKQAKLTAAAAALQAMGLIPKPVA